MVSKGPTLLLLALLAGSSPALSDDMFNGSLTGAAANPPNGSSAIGTVVMRYSASVHQLEVELTFAGLATGSTSAHIHCCVSPPTNSGIAINFLAGFPTLVTSGSYQQTFDMTNAATYYTTFLNNMGGGTALGAEAALLAGLRAGLAYIDVHSSTYPGGEIRSYPVPSVFVDDFEKGDLADWSSGCGERFVNETDLPAEADYCALTFPAVIEAGAGESIDPVFGRIFEAGLTEAAGAPSGVRAQFGFGPIGSDPRTSCSWRWKRASYNLQAGDDDEFEASIAAPVEVGSYSHTYRFSLDGAAWTACDLDGAGSNGGFSFSPAALGTMTVALP